MKNAKCCMLYVVCCLMQMVGIISPEVTGDRNVIRGGGVSSF